MGSSGWGTGVSEYLTMSPNLIFFLGGGGAEGGDGGLGGGATRHRSTANKLRDVNTI